MPKRKKATTKGRRKSQRGRGIVSDIHKFVKDNKLISKGLGLLPFPGSGIAASAASMLGYGRRRKKGTTRVRRRAVLTVSVAPKRARRSKRMMSNPVKMHGRGATMSRSHNIVSRQTGRGIFTDIGRGLGSLAGGLFG